MGIVVGRLSVGKGWGKTPEEKIKEKISHYCNSGYSQSVIYRRNVRSLSKERQRNAGDLDGLVSSVIEDLTFILTNVFRVKPEVKAWTETDPSHEGLYILFMSAEVTINGVTYDASNYVKIGE